MSSVVVMSSSKNFSYTSSYNEVISPDCLTAFKVLSDNFKLNYLSNRVLPVLNNLDVQSKVGGIYGKKFEVVLKWFNEKRVVPFFTRCRTSLDLSASRLFSLDLINLYSKKKTYFDIKLFISNYKLNIYNYNFNKDVFFFSKNIYFFNINKILFILSQFSLFFYKLLSLRCNLLFCSFNLEDYNFFSSSFRLWGYPYIVGNWVNGLFDNWLYYYRKLWNLEVDLWRLWDKKNFHYKLHRNKRFGLMGLRSLPDFMFIFNTGNGVSVNSLYQEVSRYNIPVSSIIGIKDDPRYIIYPLYGEMDNVLLKHFYKLVIINLFKMGLYKRLGDIGLV